MCLGGGRQPSAPRPAPPPPPPPVAPAPAPLPPPTPVAPPPPRQVSGVGKSAEGGFKAGRKRKKDRGAVARGTGQLRIPRTGVSTSGSSDSASGVGGLG